MEHYLKWRRILIIFVFSFFLTTNKYVACLQNLFFLAYFDDLPVTGFIIIPVFI